MVTKNLARVAPPSHRKSKRAFLFLVFLGAVSSWCFFLAWWMDPTYQQELARADSKVWAPPESSSSSNSTDVCDRIPFSLRDWVDHINIPLDASQDHKNDPNYLLRDLNALALEFITPRLSRSLEGFPHRNLDKLLHKARARYEYLRNPALYNVSETATAKTTVPPPLRIYISGGSVAAGQNCMTSLKTVLHDRCSWPTRLQLLVNNLIKGAMVEIINGSRGGANSQTGNAILTYLVEPSSAQQPFDVIINAHSVNDQIVLTRDQAQHLNLTLSDYTFDMTQNFVRHVYEHHPSAILIWLEDYVGNEARNLMELQDFSKHIHTLSKYYGFGVLSYTDAVRDVVYGDTSETMLTPVWHDQEGKMTREVHPGVMMHACVTYLWLYYGWNLMQQACSGTDQPLSLLYNATLAHEAKFDITTRLPKPLPEGMPPRLTKSLSLEHISDLWRSTAKTTTNTELDIKPSATRHDEESCPFQWTAGIQQVPNLVDLQKDSQKAFAPYLQSPTTWKLTQSDFGKGRFGWAHYKSFANSSVPQQPLQFEFPFAGIQSIAVFVAKNVDFDWRNSTAVVTVTNDRKEIIQSQHIHGYEMLPDSSKRPRKRKIIASMTRQVYLEEVDLSKVSNNSKTSGLTVQFEHVSGIGFKFMGMALCRFPPSMEGIPIPMTN